MKFPIVLNIETERETEGIAESFSKILKLGDVVALNGNLGSGKTFFVKSLCKFYNIINVSSPTFAIVNTYNGSYTVHHFDFYRIKKEEEIYDIGFNEYLNEESIVFIEWAELFSDLLPKSYFEVNIDFLSETVRQIRINKVN